MKLLVEPKAKDELKSAAILCAKLRSTGILHGMEAEFKRAYYYDPVAFIHDCFWWPSGQRSADYQDEICSMIIEKKRVAARGPHGPGKTALAAWLTLWFSLTRDGEDWKVVTTASAWRQLTHYLWPEIHKWSRKLKWKKMGRRLFSSISELMTLSLKLSWV